MLNETVNHWAEEPFQTISIQFSSGSPLRPHALDEKIHREEKKKQRLFLIIRRELFGKFRSERENRRENQQFVIIIEKKLKEKATLVLENISSFFYFLFHIITNKFNLNIFLFSSLYALHGTIHCILYTASITLIWLSPSPSFVSVFMLKLILS